MTVNCRAATARQRTPLASGAFYAPRLLEINDHFLPIAQDEVFGPVLVMQAFDTEAEAVSLANDSSYGLAASVWSRDVDRPLRVARQIEAGTVWMNSWAVVYSETEEGGFKQSGLGRMNGLAAMDDFIEFRTITHEGELMAGEAASSTVGRRSSRPHGSLPSCDALPRCRRA